MESDILRAFEETGALRTGHFHLSSGLHSDTYFQSALVLQYPERADELARSLASRLRESEPETIVGPALGGVVLGWEVARVMGARGIFTERADGKMALRRGFGVSPGERIAIVEDVVTTGKSTRETMAVLHASGAEVVAVGALVDRSAGRAALGVPFHALLSLDVKAWDPSECPACAANIPVEKPGSRPVTGASSA
ncbi:MAG: orotate phosphoribosyltransferase [Gemmatimonadota bacterium]|jgi:orotate phosphoribosyltransferase|nr:orotate phosphoribosyltransferase [Gemmatimonadota bacterium]